MSNTIKTGKELKQKIKYFASNILDFLPRNLIKRGRLLSGLSFYDDAVGLFNDNNIHVKLEIVLKDTDEQIYILYFPSDAEAQKYAKNEVAGSKIGNSIRIERQISNTKFDIENMKTFEKACIEYLDFAFSAPEIIEASTGWTLNPYLIEFGEDGKNIKMDYH